jgi:hypothetical protein
MPLQRSNGTGLKSLQEFLPPTPPPAAPVVDPPPAPRKRKRIADNDLPDCKRRRLDFDNV